MSRRVRALLALSLLVPMSCSSSAVSLQGSTVSARDLSYEIGPVPSRWRPITIQDNDLAWFAPDTAAIVHVDHTCERTQDTPLAALVQHLLIGFTQRETVLEETIPLDRREARHVIVRARLDGVPRAIELYVMKKDGCVFDLGLVAPPDRFEAARAEFTAFAMGFRTTRTPLRTQ